MSANYNSGIQHPERHTTKNNRPIDYGGVQPYGCIKSHSSYDYDINKPELHS